MVIEPGVNLREREANRGVVTRLRVPNRVTCRLEVCIFLRTMWGPSVNAREDLEFVAGEEKHGLGGSCNEHRVDVVGTSIVGPGAFPFALDGLIIGDINLTETLADVCIYGEVISTAVDVVVDHGGPAPNDPDAIMFVVHVSHVAISISDRAHNISFDAHLGISTVSVAFSFSFQVGGGGTVIRVGTELRMDIPTAPVGADLVVPTKGVSLPVLDLLVWVIEAKVEVDVREELASVDTAAHVGGTLGIRCVQQTASGTQGCVFIIAGESIIFDHVV